MASSPSGCPGVHLQGPHGLASVSHSMRAPRSSERMNQLHLGVIRAAGQVP